jgi:hypothetical protein
MADPRAIEAARDAAKLAVLTSDDVPWHGTDADLDDLLAVIFQAYLAAQPQETPEQKVAPRCEDCPPEGYPTDETRCLPCDRRQKAAPAGEWRWVPVEPTPEMYGAGGVELFKRDMAGTPPREAVGIIYRAMLAAAPQKAMEQATVDLHEQFDDLLKDRPTRFQFRERNPSSTKDIPDADGLIGLAHILAERLAGDLMVPSQSSKIVLDLADALTTERERAEKAERELTVALSDRDYWRVAYKAEHDDHRKEMVAHIATETRLAAATSQVEKIRAETRAECADFVESMADNSPGFIAQSLRDSALSPATAPLTKGAKP